MKAALAWQGAGRAGDVSGRSGRRGRRRHGRARDRRRAARSTCSTKRCRTSPTSSRRWRPTRRPCSPAATRKQGNAEETGDLDAGFKQAAHVVEADVLDARHHARLPRDARLRLRVGRRQADGVGVDAGACTARSDGFAQALKHSAGERARHHAVHGRRLRQQVRTGRAGPHLRASSRSRRSAPVKLMLDRKEEHLDTGNRPSATAHIKRRRVGRRHADRVRRPELGHRRRRRRRRISRCRTSTSSRTAAGRTRTSTSTPASSARCARRAIRRDASSPKS